MAIISAFRRLKQKVLIQAQFQVHSDAMSNKNQEKRGERSNKRREMGKEGKMGEEEVGGREKQED